MIFLIIAVNLSITLLNIYIALRIVQLQVIISRISAILINYESYFHVLLKTAPEVIDQGGKNIYHVRQRYQLLQLQITQIKQLIWLINWSFQVWRRI